jgi:ABC-type transporter Mla subunit MlaD
VTRIKHTKERSNFKAGLLTITLVLAGFAIVLGVIRRNASNEKGTNYSVSFTMKDGVGSLQAGSTITAAGIKVGQIKRVSISDGELTAGIFIKSPYNLFPGALIYRTDSLMGGAATLTIGWFGDDTKPEIQEGKRINSAPQPPAINGLLGDKTASRIESIQKNTEELVLGVQQITADLRNNGDLRDLDEDFRGMMNRTSSDMETWEPRLQRIEKRVESFQAQFPSLNQELEQLTEAAQLTEQRIFEFREAVGPKQRKMIMDAVNDSIEEVKKASAKVQEQVIPQIDSIVAKATENWSDLESIEDLLKTMARDARETLQIAVANSALAAQQLVLAQKEIISSLGIPLLEKPSIEDQRLGLRIEILESWARSATQLRRFLQALETIKRSAVDDSNTLEDDVLLERVVDSLRAALLDFEEAQSKLISLDARQKDAADETDDQNR